MNLPFADNTFDLVYSYGVFHHTPNPEKAFDEAIRVLKKGGKFCTYLYEKHEDNLYKRVPLEIIEKFHFFTRKLSHRQLKTLCYLMTPFILLFLSLPAQLLKSFSQTRKFGEKIPYHHGIFPKNIIGDLMDRFGASINFRFSRKDIEELFKKNKIENFHITKIADRAGYVAYAQK